MPLNPSRLLAIRSTTFSSTRSVFSSSVRLFSSSLPSPAIPAASSSSASSSSSSSDPWQSRAALPKKKNDRRKGDKFPERKTFQYNYYTHLTDTTALTLLFEYDNCSSKVFDSIKSAIGKIPAPKTPFEPVVKSASASSPSLSSSSSDASAEAGQKKKRKRKSKAAKAADMESGAEDATKKASTTPNVDLRAKFFMVRSGVLGAIHRARPREASLAPWCQGQRAFLVCPTISPAYLGKVLGAVNKVMRDVSKQAESSATKKVPALNLLVGLADGNRVLPAAQIQALTKVPELDTLRAQVVGMLEGQGRSLVGVLSQAGGGALFRTLQGLEAGMKEGAGGAEAKP